MNESKRFRGVLLWAAALRVVLGIAAIPLAPFLYKRHFLVLVLLRPTKEVLLAAAFLARRDRVNLAAAVIAALPLMILGVWLFFYLGKGFSSDTLSKHRIGSWVLPLDKIRKLRTVLEKKGMKVVFIGRLAAFPSTLVAAAAGSSDMPSRRFLPADGLGAVLGVAEVVVAGYILGETYDSSKPWITALGVAGLVALAVLVGRYLRRQ
ncbi:MAG TPA: VTT domain-containing protein [Actinomycetota bacterium]|nr:VTT domain-containing protein [Actinomycetota bacterium]